MNNPKAKTVLAVFAHPDDESLVAGGTLARFDHEGYFTALLCATRGEWGPISDESLATYETLGQVREGELRAACEILGIKWLQFLDLPDGGVTWAIEDASYQALEKVVRVIRELQPEIVITFGPDGFYGHEDHIAIGKLTTKACQLTAQAEVFPEHLAMGLTAHRPAKLYYAVYPQGKMEELVTNLKQEHMNVNLWGIAPAQFGIPMEQITLSLDVKDFLTTRCNALKCHRTQIDATNVFAVMREEHAEQYFGMEYFQVEL